LEAAKSGLFGSAAIVQITNLLTSLIAQPG